MRRVSLFLGIFLLLLSVSCSRPSGPYAPLADKGIMPLSATNPYLGANLFLAEQMERERTLFDFFQARGAPAAIQVEELTQKATSVRLFYPEAQEEYRAVLKGTARWVVAGPFPIKRQDYRYVTRVAARDARPAVFVIRGKKVDFRPRVETSAPVRVVPEIPTPVPTPTPKPKVKPKPKVVAPEGEAKQPVKPLPALPSVGGAFQPLTTDQQAIQMSKGFAERAPNGDVLHRVKSETETIMDIAKWYTQDAGRAEELMQLNGIKDKSETLSPGRKVRIPLAAVKEFKAMP